MAHGLWGSLIILIVSFVLIGIAQDTTPIVPTGVGGGGDMFTASNNVTKVGTTQTVAGAFFLVTNGNAGYQGAAIHLNAALPGGLDDRGSAIIMIATNGVGTNYIGTINIGGSAQHIMRDYGSPGAPTHYRWIFPNLEVLPDGTSSSKVTVSPGGREFIVLGGASSDAELYVSTNLLIFGVESSDSMTWNTISIAIPNGIDIGSGQLQIPATGVITNTGPGITTLNTLRGSNIIATSTLNLTNLVNGSDVFLDAGLGTFLTSPGGSSITLISSNNTLFSIGVRAGGGGAIRDKNTSFVLIWDAPAAASTMRIAEDFGKISVGANAGNEFFVHGNTSANSEFYVSTNLIIAGDESSDSWTWNLISQSIPNGFDIGSGYWQGKVGSFLTNIGPGILTRGDLKADSLVHSTNSVVPYWIKFGIHFTNLNAASVTNTFIFYNLPASNVVHGFVLRPTASWLGTNGLGNVTMSIGFTNIGQRVRYSEPFSVTNPITSTYALSSQRFLLEDFSSSTPIAAILVSGNTTNLNALTNGFVDIYGQFSRLPVP